MSDKFLIVPGIHNEAQILRTYLLFVPQNKLNVSLALGDTCLQAASQALLKLALIVWKRFVSSIAL